MSDPVEFLRAKLDEFEQLAKDMGEDKPVWYRGLDVGDYYNFETVTRKPVTKYVGFDSDVVVSCGYGDEGRLLADYIATFDPATVLQLVAATRQLLELHSEIEPGSAQCSHCDDGYQRPLYWPCPTLELIAAGWGWTDD